MSKYYQKAFEEETVDLIATCVQREDGITHIAMNMSLVGDPFGQVRVEYEVVLNTQYRAVGETFDEALLRAKDRMDEDMQSSRTVEVPRNTIGMVAIDPAASKGVCLDDEIPF